MDETGTHAPRRDRDRSSRFGEVLQRAYAEDGRSLPDEITRLMLDLSRIEEPAAAEGVRRGSGTAENAAGATATGGSARRWSPAALLGRWRGRP